jgi:hypothetical protein
MMVNTLTDDPLANEVLSLSQPKIEANNKYFAHTLVVDHQIGDATAGLTGARNDGIPKEGYHTTVHFVDRGAFPSFPAPIAGTGQLFTNTANGDQALFYESGGGVAIQLSNPIGAKAATNGWAPFGFFIVQWGIIPLAASGAFTPVLFATSNINFPSNCFNVVLTMINNQGNHPSANSVFVTAGTVSNLGFSITNTTGSSTQSAYWLAIGN